MVQFYQRHTHSKTCRKYKNIQCRFDFGKLFTSRTIVSVPLADDISDPVRSGILEKRCDILSKVKAKINESLDPSKQDYDQTSDISIEVILQELGITLEEYYNALQISGDKDLHLHLKRSPKSCFINNYFVVGIKGWKANVDLQPVYNYHKCISYICSYFSKDENESSEAIRNAAKEARENNLDLRTSLKKVGAAFLSSREVSAQECVYRCMPELWLTKRYPATIFVNTNLPNERLRMRKSDEEIALLDNDSTDIFKSNIINRYCDRPNCTFMNGRFAAVDRICLAEFAAYYYKDYNRGEESDDVNDSQPELLSDTVVESQHDSTSALPQSIKLMSGKETMKCRKVKAVIRYYKPNKDSEYEKYCHHLLMLFYPWRNELELLGEEHTYASKLACAAVADVVQQNKNKFEFDSDEIEEAMEYVRNNPTFDQFHGNLDPINEQENADIRESFASSTDNTSDENTDIEQVLAGPSNSVDSQTEMPLSIIQQPCSITDDFFRSMVRSLNKKQRMAYDIVLGWSRKKIKSLSVPGKKDVDPLRLFITGDAGTGKSHLIKTIFHSILRTFKHGNDDPDKPSVLLTAPTGVAAINIDGTTINSALGLPGNLFENSVPALSDKRKSLLKAQLSNVKLLIIDEVSMVSNVMLLHIHNRLTHIFGTPQTLPFAGLSILAIGDFYQLPPCKRKPIFCNFNNELKNLNHPWRLFQMIELTQIMRQVGDNKFTQLLNRCRRGGINIDDEETLKQRVVSCTDASYPEDALHIWAENVFVKNHNKQKLDKLEKPSITLMAKDRLPKGISVSALQIASNSCSDNCGLDSEIEIKEGARIMLTKNISVADRLINGQLGTISKVAFHDFTNEVSVLYISFDDERAGKETIKNCTDLFAKRNNLVPIVPVSANIKINPKRMNSPEIVRTQFPVTLAWACTVHKVQGLTLDKIVISFALNKQRAFQNGQAYVALSRVRTLDGLFILDKFDPNQIRADDRVTEEYERLRRISDVASDSCRNSITSSNRIQVSLLNVRSFMKHWEDLLCDPILKTSDLILFDISFCKFQREKIFPFNQWMAFCS